MEIYHQIDMLRPCPARSTPGASLRGREVHSRLYTSPPPLAPLSACFSSRRLWRFPWGEASAGAATRGWVPPTRRWGDPGGGAAATSGTTGLRCTPPRRLSSRTAAASASCACTSVLPPPSPPLPPPPPPPPPPAAVAVARRGGCSHLHGHGHHRAALNLVPAPQLPPRGLLCCPHMHLCVAPATEVWAGDFVVAWQSHRAINHPTL